MKRDKEENLRRKVRQTRGKRAHVSVKARQQIRREQYKNPSLLL